MIEDLGFIHRFVPGESDRSLVLLHGTGANEDDLLPLGRRLDPDANLLSPRGKVLEQGMPRFFRRLEMGVFDLEDLERRTHELADFIEAAVEAYGLDAQKLVLAGYSNGANIGGSLLLRRPGLVPAAILMHAMVPFEPDSAPDLGSTSVLITGGRRDPMIPGDQTERLAEILREAGADVALEWQPGGHELTEAEVGAIETWLAKLP